MSAFEPMASAGLFVGVSCFEDQRIAAVPFAVDDAVDLAHIFISELGLITPERTVLLLSGEPRKVESIERLASLIGRGVVLHGARMRDIYHYLGELTRSTERSGLFVLTVATHGVSDQGGDFLVATDSLKERTLRTGVAVAELFDEVSRASAEHRLVLLDACRERLSQGTRGAAEFAMAQSFAEAISLAKGSAVLSAATLGGFAYDDQERQNGVFTAALIDGLRGNAKANANGWITIRTLADFVQERVSTWVLRNRPDHAAKSLGIGRRVEATADAFPLAPHPEALQEQRRYHLRREAALAKVKENQGKVLTGAFWDQIFVLLPEEEPNPAALRLLGEIEALDGSERSQRSLRDFVRELLPSIPKQQEPATEGKARLVSGASREEKGLEKVDTVRRGTEPPSVQSETIHSKAFIGPAIRRLSVWLLLVSLVILFVWVWGHWRSPSVLFRPFGPTTPSRSESHEASFSKPDTLTGRPKIAKILFTSGHGERSLRGQDSRGLSVAEKMLPRDSFDLREWSSTSNLAVPAGTDLVVIAGPTGSFGQAELTALNVYLLSGGSLFVLLDPVFEKSAHGGLMQTGLEEWLLRWRIQVGQDIVVDPSIAIPGFGPETLLVKGYGSHPITESLRQGGIPVLLSVVRSVSLAADGSGTILLSTSTAGWGERDLVHLDRVQRNDSDFPGPVPLGVAVEYKVGGDVMRLAVIGDSDLAGNQLAAVNSGNSIMLTNILHWLVTRDNS